MALSLRLRLLNQALRWVGRPLLARATDPVLSRRRFSVLAKAFRKPPYLLHLPGALHRVTVRPTSAPFAVLYLHGGAYMTGSPVTHLALAGRLARLTGLPVFLPQYRLAPEHPAPAAFEDAVAAHASLLVKGYAPSQITLGGDSAGGGLALALLAQLCAQNQRPAGAFAFSPWTDLALQGASLTTNAVADVLLPSAKLADAVAMILGSLAPTDPRLSPQYAAFRDPPPVFLQVGSTEILLDDSRRMADHLHQSGGTVALQVWPDSPHVWQMLDGYLPEARAALRQTAAFILTLCHPQPPAES